MRRIRQLGMFQGLELDSEELEELPSVPLGYPQLVDPNSRWLEAHGFSERRLDYDPCSDPLDDPFPEELR